MSKCVCVCVCVCSPRMRGWLMWVTIVENPTLLLHPPPPSLQPEAIRKREVSLCGTSCHHNVIRMNLRSECSQRDAAIFMNLLAVWALFAPLYLVYIYFNQKLSVVSIIITVSSSSCQNIKTTRVARRHLWFVVVWIQTAFSLCKFTGLTLLSLARQIFSSVRRSLLTLICFLTELQTLKELEPDRSQLIQGCCWRSSI